jgi:hypothetical protein
MRTTALFWGSILIVMGVLFLLSTLGIITVDIWGIIWPTFLILAGVWLLWGAIFRPKLRSEHATIPLEGAERAQVRLSHGAGRLDIHAGAGPENLVEGDFGGGLDLRQQRSGDLLEARMSIADHWGGFHFWDSGRLDWDVAFNQNVPISLQIDGGANNIHLDLTDLKVTDFTMKNGASSTEIIFPANAGLTRARISSGAASLQARIPPGVAGRIRFQGGMSTLNVDSRRFPSQAGVYQSPDFDIAQNKVDLEIEMGAGSVEVK